MRVHLLHISKQLPVWADAQPSQVFLLQAVQAVQEQLGNPAGSTLTSSWSATKLLS